MSSQPRPAMKKASHETEELLRKISHQLEVLTIEIRKRLPPRDISDQEYEFEVEGLRKAVNLLSQKTE